MRPVEEVGLAFGKVIENLPGGGESRSGQWEMLDGVTNAITNKKHLVVQAGTGTGKTLAYLVPCIVLGARTIVATTTNR